MPDPAKLIQRLRADDPAFASSLDFGPHVAQGDADGPSLLIGDLSQISLLRTSPEPSLDHRMAHVAASGDIVLVKARDPAFETYLKDYRGLDDLTVLAANPADDRPVATQARVTKGLRDTITHVARRNSALTIKSYLTTGTIWRLAQSIGAAAGCTIHVSGPAPRISKHANDKLWFTRIARSVIGTDAVPPTMSAYGPQAASALILRLGRAGNQVIVKVPDSAGSAGNVRLDPALLAQQTLDSTQALLLDQLHARGWADSYPILVGVWDSDVASSPSVQMWIPITGPAVVQAIFEQTVLGENGAFVGAQRAMLPAAQQDQLVTQATRIARVLQELGYYGKCSLDAVICKHGAIHWIECNGRWTGVSIPLHAKTDIAPSDDPGGIVVVQQMLKGRTLGTEAAVQALDPLLYRKQSGNAPKEGVVILSPPARAAGLVANLLVFAATQPAAQRLSKKALDQLSAAAMPLQAAGYQGA